MAARRCATCDIEVRDQLIICKRCERECRRYLVNQAAYYAELQLELRRETRKHELFKSAGLQWRIPFNDQASRLIRRQQTLLAGWTTTLTRMRPAPAGPWCSQACKHGSCKAARDHRPPAGSVAAQSIWLAMHVGFLRRRVESKLLLEALRRLDRDVINLVDLPANRSRVHVGPCPNVWPVAGGGQEHCPGQVDAHFPLDVEAPCHMVCSACGEQWPSWQWNRVGSRILGRAEQLQQQAALARSIGGAA